MLRIMIIIFVITNMIMIMIINLKLTLLLTRSVLTYRNMERDFSGGWKVVAKNRWQHFPPIIQSHISIVSHFNLNHPFPAKAKTSTRSA